MLVIRRGLPGMILPMHVFEPPVCNVRIDLRRRKVFVPEHFLDRAEIGSGAKKFCGE